LSLDGGSITFRGPENFLRRHVERLVDRPSVDFGPLEQQLIAAKRPSGHPEIVAVLACALAQQGHSQFDAAQMMAAYRRAGVRPPRVLGQALRDARNRLGYLEAGTRRGAYRLSPAGERMVRLDLPRDAAPRSLLELDGLGREVWRGVDPKRYINRLRNEWDH
jgi:hypothetical protein